MRDGTRTLLILALLAATTAPIRGKAPDVLPDTQPLTWTGDIASRMIDGIDRFLLHQIELSREQRQTFWRRDLTTPTAYAASIAARRHRLAHILGVRDDRLAFQGLELVGTTSQPALVGQGEHFKAYAVRWPVIRQIHGEGLLLVPDTDVPRANIVAIPDADQTPEMICGLEEGVPVGSQYARWLAEGGCRVLVPVLIDRKLERRNGRAWLTTREYLYRTAFDLGRHLIGYEVQKVLAGVDWFERQSPDGAPHTGVVGWGEGGMLALYCAALDQRISLACVSGYFEPRERIWQQPIDRNVFGLLEQFGDAELASMVAPRTLIVEAARGPELTLKPGQGGAPARLATPKLEAVRAEVQRAQSLVKGLTKEPSIVLEVSGAGTGPFLTRTTLTRVLDRLAPGATVPATATAVKTLGVPVPAAQRAARQRDEIDQHDQWLIGESRYTRQEFMKDLNTDSLEAYRKSVESYRDIFRREIIGHFDQPLVNPNPRTRLAYDTPKWAGYEVVLDVFPDVFAYGILLLPKDVKPGERRPVVVCQHGLEGRAQDVVQGADRAKRAYHDFAAQLADRGFIAFAPQNIYIFGDRFRTLQRKAYPLKKTLFSIMVPQHQQIVNWLGSLPQVDPKRIAFYGLSYGGKSAMRIPALVTDYCLSICSGDFNEWVWKNTSTRAKYSYVWTGEYEIFEYDLGGTFNYAEMAALIAPRPFMVERGHFDGVAPDEMVAYEFAKVRFLYEAQLKLNDRCTIEWFVGPHMINGVGTFQFLHHHLDWPQP